MLIEGDAPKLASVIASLENVVLSNIDPTNPPTPAVDDVPFDLIVRLGLATDVATLKMELPEKVVNIIEPIKPPTLLPPAMLPELKKSPEKVVAAVPPNTEPKMPPTLLLLALGVVIFVPAKTLPVFVKFVFNALASVALKKPTTPPMLEVVPAADVADTVAAFVSAAGENTT